MAPLSHHRLAGPLCRAGVNYFVIVKISTPPHVIANVIVIELSWRKVIVIDTISNCNYSITFPITSENANKPNTWNCPITVKGQCRQVYCDKG